MIATWHSWHPWPPKTQKSPERYIITGTRSQKEKAQFKPKPTSSTWKLLLQSDSPSNLASLLRSPNSEVTGIACRTFMLVSLEGQCPWGLVPFSSSRFYLGAPDHGGPPPPPQALLGGNSFTRPKGFLTHQFSKRYRAQTWEPLSKTSLLPQRRQKEMCDTEHATYPSSSAVSM